MEYLCSFSLMGYSGTTSIWASVEIEETMHLQLIDRNGARNYTNKFALVYMCICVCVLPCVCVCSIACVL